MRRGGNFDDPRRGLIMDMVSRFAPVDVDGVPVLMSALEIETWGQEIRDARPIAMRMNILTRRGIFAVKTCESGYYSGSMYGWRWFIAECRAHQARDMAQVAYSYSPRPDGAKRDRRSSARIIS
jgi:hypothetical protein